MRRARRSKSDGRAVGADDGAERLASAAIEATQRVDPVPDDVVAAARAVFKGRGAARRPDRRR